MRISEILLSVGLLIIILGSIIFPISTSPATYKGVFTLPHWAKTAYLLGNITVNNTYVTTSFTLNNTNITVSGNITVIFHGIRLFYGSPYKEVGISLAAIGGVLLLVKYFLTRGSKRRL
ncbi:hypothetical protein [Stygiolobus caldivivus]|uniref:Uncharacterized protein n=1 Tax=Stygiolobus caldivivus TaxID=2824673 RepID=A0A8D5ZJE6_9CREN|nr:hypothetical protein [Stygiolobus caldivivus]BCU70290.1 hypothetical protein KN1_15870 [Stygiolobus caldivivus]